MGPKKPFKACGLNNISIAPLRVLPELIDYRRKNRYSADKK
jgi:hypothetical protein